MEIISNAELINLLLVLAAAAAGAGIMAGLLGVCLLYTSPSPRD